MKPGGCESSGAAQKAAGSCCTRCEEWNAAGCRRRSQAEAHRTSDSSSFSANKSLISDWYGTSR